MIRNPITARARPVNVQRTQRGSALGRGLATTVASGGGSTASLRGGSVSIRMSLALTAMAATPTLEDIPQCKHHERQSEQHNGYRCRLGISECSEASHNQDRRDFGFEWHVARDEDH